MITFHYVTYSELSDIGSHHPILENYFSNDACDFYSSCPDMTQDFPIFFYLTLDGCIVSHIKSIPDKLVDKQGCVHSWAWTGGLVTKPQFRGRGFAKHLIRQALAVFDEKGISRGSVYSARETLHIYNNIDGVTTGFVSRYVLLKSVKPILRKYVGNGHLMKTIDCLFYYTYFLLLLSIFKLRSNHGRYGLIKLSDNEFINSDLTVRNDNVCYFNSSAEKILWKIRNSKNKQELYFITDDKKSINGYVIIRRKHIPYNKENSFSDYHLMTLMDYGSYIADNKLFCDAMIEATTKLFLDSDCNVLEIISSSKYVVSKLKNNIFIKAGRGMSFTFNCSDMCDIKFRTNLNDWHLTSFCGDAFTYK